MSFVGQLAGLMLLVATQLHAQQDRWDTQVAKALDRSAVALRERGYHPSGDYRKGLLFVDESEKIEIPVDGKQDVVVIGACDDECTGLQLVIGNGTGYELDAARGPGNSPVVHLRPPLRPGSYRVKVTMSGCRVSPCRYGVAVFVR